MIGQGARRNEVANEGDARQHMRRTRQTLIHLRCEFGARPAGPDEALARRSGVPESLSVIRLSIFDLQRVPHTRAECATVSLNAGNDLHAVS